MSPELVTGMFLATLSSPAKCGTVIMGFLSNSTAKSNSILLVEEQTLETQGQGWFL